MTIFTIAATIIGSSWFGLEYFVNGPEFLSSFTAYQARLLLTGYGHGHPVYYHFLTTFIGCFPMSVVALWKSWTARKRGLATTESALRWMALTFWCVMIVFSLVTTKILHYVSLAYIPLAYFAALTLCTFGQGRRPSTLYSVVLITVASCWALAAIVAPVAMLWRDEWAASLINDTFARSNVLAPVRWTLFDVLPGLLFLLGLAGAVVHLRRRRAVAAHVWLFASGVVAATVAAFLLVPKIHEHTQGALLRFLHLARTEQTMATTTFVSYVQYFYFDLHVVRDVSNGKHAPRYVIGRLRDAPNPQHVLTKIREENGYILFRAHGRSASGIH